MRLVMIILVDKGQPVHLSIHLSLVSLAHWSDSVYKSVLLGTIWRRFFIFIFMLTLRTLTLLFIFILFTYVFDDWNLTKNTWQFCRVLSQHKGFLKPVLGTIFRPTFLVVLDVKILNLPNIYTHIQQRQGIFTAVHEKIRSLQKCAKFFMLSFLLSIYHYSLHLFMLSFFSFCM